MTSNEVTPPQNGGIPPIVTEIGQRIAIKGMNLVRCSCEVVGTATPGTPIPEMKFETRGGGTVHADEPRTIVCGFGLDVTAIGPAPASEPIAKFSVDYAVQYEMQDEAFLQRLSEHDLALFAAYNTSFHVWPHAREFVQSMAGRMSLPPVVLPIFRPQQLIGPPENWKRRTDASAEKH